MEVYCPIFHAVFPGQGGVAAAGTGTDSFPKQQKGDLLALLHNTSQRDATRTCGCWPQIK